MFFKDTGRTQEESTKSNSTANFKYHLKILKFISYISKLHHFKSKHNKILSTEEKLVVTEKYTIFFSFSAPFSQLYGSKSSSLFPSILQSYPDLWPQQFLQLLAFLRISKLRQMTRFQRKCLYMLYKLPYHRFTQHIDKVNDMYLNYIWCLILAPTVSANTSVFQEF